MSEPVTEEEQLKARLEAARQKTAEFERRREERLETQQLRDQVEDAERQARLEEAIADAEAEHGALGRHIKVVHAIYDDEHIRGSMIIKRPNPLIFKRFRDTGSMKSKDIEKLWCSCLVWPDKSSVESMIEELPHTELKLANACADLAGASKKEIAGK